MVQITGDLSRDELPKAALAVWDVEDEEGDSPIVEDGDSK